MKITKDLTKCKNSCRAKSEPQNRTMHDDLDLKSKTKSPLHKVHESQEAEKIQGSGTSEESGVHC